MNDPDAPNLARRSTQLIIIVSPVMRTALSAVLTVVLFVLAFNLFHHVPDEVFETQRVEKYIAGALNVLDSANLDGYTDDQLLARQRAIGWLREYRDNGVFPHNHVLPGRRTPVFVDPHGTPCAVGYLMLRSGEFGLVEDIVRHSNLATVAELAADPRIVAWLGEHGISQAEAARIQPQYDGFPGQPDNEVRERSRYATATAGLALTSVAATAYSEAVEPRGGRFDWPMAATLAATAGHAALLIARTDGNSHQKRWETPVNYAGVFLGLVTIVRRLNRAYGNEKNDASYGKVVPIVAPGQDGLTLGLRIRR